MVDFVLDDLRRPTFKGFDPGLQAFIFVLDLDLLIALAGPRTA
jgi:hypothetical protein